MHRHALLYIFDKILAPKTMSTTVHRSIQEMPYDMIKRGIKFSKNYFLSSQLEEGSRNGLIWNGPKY